MTDELDLLASFKNLLRNWWKIILAAYLVALVGLVASYLLPATYQAEAVFQASIDFTQINFENLLAEGEQQAYFTQYDEDLALQVVWRAFMAERANAFEYALTLDPTLDEATFDQNFLIERSNAEWTLNYRHVDPAVAQAVVNYWADQAWDYLQTAQANGEAESFVIVARVQDASLPQKPTYQNRGTLALSGTLIGIILGVLWVDGRMRFGTPHPQEA